MTYKLNDEYKKIKSPIILQYCGQEIHLDKGKDLLNLEFDESFVIEEVYAEDSKIIMILRRTKFNPIADWTDDKNVSFF